MHLARNSILVAEQKWHAQDTGNGSGCKVDVEHKQDDFSGCMNRSGEQEFDRATCIDAPNVALAGETDEISRTLTVAA